MRSLAVVLPNWIGDAAMATPAVRALRIAHPGAKFVAVAGPAVAELFAACPWFDAIIPYAKRNLPATIRALAAHRPDAAVLFPNSFRAAAVARLAGCSRVVGFARYFRDVLLTDRLYPRRDRTGRPKPSPVIDDYNRLALRFGAAPPGHRMELFPAAAGESAAADVWAANRFDRTRGVIGLNPGGAFGAAKHWPEVHFTALARRFAADGYGVLVLCGPAERDAARRIAVAANHPAVASLGDNAPSLHLSMACVKRMAALVTTDSGPRHFAAAFGLPVVTLYGPTHIAWTETYWARAVHLQLKMPCGPCQQRVCPLGHHRCMTDLTPAAVHEATMKLLAREEARHAG